MDIFKPFELCLADLLPPGIVLTANEMKVLFVLRGACVGRSNVAAIDQEKIAELSGIRRQNVARATAGLRTKGMLLKTWMESGPKMYRNIYALWVPPEILERDANHMREQREQAQALEREAEQAERKAIEVATPHLQHADDARRKAKIVRETACTVCGGEGVVMAYVPAESRERAKWCICSQGRQLAAGAGHPNAAFVPETSLPNDSQTGSQT